MNGTCKDRAEQGQGLRTRYLLTAKHDQSDLERDCGDRKSEKYSTALPYSRLALPCPAQTKETNDQVQGIGDDGLMQRYCLYVHTCVRIWLDEVRSRYRGDRIRLLPVLSKGQQVQEGLKAVSDPSSFSSFFPSFRGGERGFGGCFVELTMWLRMLCGEGTAGRCARMKAHTCAYLRLVDICYDWICISTIADPLCGICSMYFEYFKHCNM